MINNQSIPLFNCICKAKTTNCSLADLGCVGHQKGTKTLIQTSSQQEALSAHHPANSFYGR